jgi:hypothetical protein
MGEGLIMAQLGVGGWGLERLGIFRPRARMSALSATPQPPVKAIVQP